MHEAQKSKSFETFRFLCVCFHSSFLNLINVVHKTGENEKIRVVSGTDCTRQKRLVARPFFFFFCQQGAILFVLCDPKPGGGMPNALVFIVVLR